MGKLNKTAMDPVGVVGLGLMGSSIVTALVLSGHRVVAVAPMKDDLEYSPGKVRHYLSQCLEIQERRSGVKSYFEQIKFTDDYGALRGCALVMECVTENIEIKKKVFSLIESNVTAKSVITTNTSAIPISILKDFLKKPGRFVGMHWAEPAFTTRFLEIICSDATDIRIAKRLYRVAAGWGKEPTLVRKDIRGFITNRIMYAMYREAFWLVENGYATIEDVDRSCRNDGGQWMPFCGPFRYMDLTGLQAYYHVMKDLFPTLSSQTSVPSLIKDIAEKGGNGITNGRGFYRYTKPEVAEWEKAYEEFAFDINRLSAKYPSDLIKRRMAKRRRGAKFDSK